MRQFILLQCAATREWMKQFTHFHDVVFCFTRKYANSSSRDMPLIHGDFIGHCIGVRKRGLVFSLWFFVNAQQKPKRCFQILFTSTSTWGNDPIWRAYFSNGLVKNHQLEMIFWNQVPGDRPTTPLTLHTSKKLNFYVPPSFWNPSWDV